MQNTQRNSEQSIQEFDFGAEISSNPSTHGASQRESAILVLIEVFCRAKGLLLWHQGSPLPREQQKALNLYSEGTWIILWFYKESKTNCKKKPT